MKFTDYVLVSDYMNDEQRRHALNTLAQNTFNINFEEWYQNGFCGNQYLPYALWNGDKIIANVSANPITNRIVKNRYCTMNTIPIFVYE